MFQMVCRSGQCLSQLTFHAFDRHKIRKDRLLSLSQFQHCLSLFMFLLHQIHWFGNLRHTNRSVFPRITLRLTFCLNICRLHLLLRNVDHRNILESIRLFLDFFLRILSFFLLYILWNIFIGEVFYICVIRLLLHRNFCLGKWHLHVCFFRCILRHILLNRCLLRKKFLGLKFFLHSFIR